MSDILSIGQLGVVAPFKAKEGSITMKNGATAHGNIKVPVLSAELNKGDYVTLDSEMTVKKAGDSDTIFGIVYNTPKWTGVEPAADYNQSQAVSAGLLREVGIDTIFKKILTVPAKASEGITAGIYLVFKTTGMELSSSSGATATDYVALSAQDSNDLVVVGFI